MKTFCTTIFITLIILLTSCGEAKYSASTYYLDYNKYNKAGFYVSEGTNPPFSFTEMGRVSCTVGSGVVSDKEMLSLPLDEQYNSEPSNGKYNIKATEAAALRILVDKVKALGGNGIIELRTNYHYEGGRLVAEANAIAIKR